MDTMKRKIGNTLVTSIMSEKETESFAIRRLFLVSLKIKTTKAQPWEHLRLSLLRITKILWIKPVNILRIRKSWRGTYWSIREI